MNEFSKYKSIDIKTLKWGTPPVPLIPKILRVTWKEDIIPAWVCSELGISEGSTMASLGSNVWNGMKAINPRLKHYLAFTVRARASSIKHLRCVERPWPLGLRPTDIAWNIRIKNCLSNLGLLTDEQRLAELTFGDLLSMSGIGASSALDYSATLEAAMDNFEQLTIEYINDKNNYDSAALLAAIEEIVNQEWAEQISDKDPRFAPLLPRGHGTLQERLENMISEPDSISNISDLPTLLKSIEKIKEKTRDLQKCPLEDCLLDFLQLVSRDTGKRLEVLAERFGWTGKEPITLEECGEKLGVTRERIRQIQKRIIDRIPKHPVFMPKLDLAIALLEKLAPIPLKDASFRVYKEGITSTEFDPRVILEAAQQLGRETNLSICEIGGEKVVVDSEKPKSLQIIPKIARKLAGHSGITNVFQVLDLVNEEGFEIQEEEVRGILNRMTKFEFLDEDWFWATDIVDERNRLYNVSRKILSVASPQSINSIREGIRRVYRWRNLTNTRYSNLIVPPVVILKRFYEKHDSFQVKGDLVYFNGVLDYKRELGKVECVIVEVLHSTPSGLLDRDSFSETCISRGVNENTFPVYTTYSPILEHIAHMVWKLRGIKVDPTDVEAIRLATHRTKEKRVLEHGWGQDGKIWISVRVPKLSGSIVIGCPGPYKRFLVGREFTCISKADQKKCGTITFNENGSSYGYGIYMQRYGIDENDILKAEFNLMNHEVSLSVSPDELDE